MSVLRIIFTAVLASLAALLIAARILLIADRKPIHLLEHIGAFGLALCIAASAFYYFRSRAHWEARLACPSCEHRGSLRLSSLGQPRISITAWILGGIIGSLLYSHARKRRFYCDTCHQSSDVRTPGGWLAVAWLLLLIFALGTEVYVHGNE